jgi:hypothetical protein
MLRNTIHTIDLDTKLMYAMREDESGCKSPSQLQSVHQGSGIASGEVKKGASFVSGLRSPP